MKRLFSRHQMSVIVVALVLASASIIAEPLPVVRYEQAQSNWCWAASITSVLNRYGIWPSWGDGSGQCAVVNRHMGRTDCCGSPALCNQGALTTSHDNDVESWGVDATHQTSALSWDDVEDENDAGRPFLFRWGWDSGGGHLLVGVGTNTVGGMYYIDPWLGASGDYWQSSYDYVTDADSHTWTDTILINENPPEDVMVRDSFSETNWTYETTGDITVQDFVVLEDRITLRGDSIRLRPGFSALSGCTLEVQPN